MDSMHPGRYLPRALSMDAIHDIEAVEANEVWLECMLKWSGRQRFDVMGIEEQHLRVGRTPA